MGFEFPDDNKKVEMTDCEMMTRFIEENTDIALKYIMWQENFLDPQVFDSNVNIDADDVDHEDVN